MSIPIELPLDSDGFLRRECPSCEGQFKWRSDDAETGDSTPVEQYFCPLCGVAAGLDQWWTPEQLDYAEASAASSPEVDNLIQDLIGDSFKGMKGITFKPNRDFHLDNDAPVPLAEPDDMEIAEPPCHPEEPVKVPEGATGRIHCLICGAPFTA